MIDELKYYFNKILWEYINAYQYSFFGWLNFKWHKNFWYSMIYSNNGYLIIKNGNTYHIGWKGKLNNYFSQSKIKKYLCKRKGWKC